MMKCAGDRIRAYREKHGLRQIDLARVASIPQQRVSSLETGYATHLRVDLAMRLANAMGMSVEELFAEFSPVRHPKRPPTRRPQ